MSQLRFAALPRWVYVLAVVAWSTIIALLTIGIVKSCTDHHVDPPVIVTAPDGGRRAVVIEQRLDAAVVQHEEAVRVIERTVIVQRVEHERTADAEELAVRSQGRQALASWLSDFAGTVGVRDAGVDATTGAP